MPFRFCSSVCEGCVRELRKVRNECDLSITVMQASEVPAIRGHEGSGKSNSLSGALNGSDNTPPPAPPARPHEIKIIVIMDKSQNSLTIPFSRYFFQAQRSRNNNI